MRPWVGYIATSLLGARTLLGAPGISRSKNAIRGTRSQADNGQARTPSRNDLEAAEEADLQVPVLADFKSIRQEGLTTPYYCKDMFYVFSSFSSIFP